MRYPKDHKKQARAAILATAAHTLKEKGFQGVGVDGLAASAQVTSGALYSHFGSKEAFLEQVVDAQLGAEFTVVDDPDPAERRRRLVEFLGVYLSDDHREDVAHGCVMPALSADVSRAGDSVREAYQRRVLDVVALLAPAMQGTAEEREERAWAMVAAMVGAVTLARALPAGEQAKSVLDAVLQATRKAVTDSPAA
ncbi:TetR/AcrR family transcriptional regulator [Streptomyces xylophagus]|uniref:TetR/AcrR family transcriptional regulator n=1 Tax=Streptomyces xylophagus TaxID=285514 RepID=UPI0005B9F5DE|nr:TetR/AcrR family transcriptional regulator [Streptomyces xylophagus]